MKDPAAPQISSTLIFVCISGWAGLESLCLLGTLVKGLLTGLVLLLPLWLALGMLTIYIIVSFELRLQSLCRQLLVNQQETVAPVSSGSSYAIGLLAWALLLSAALILKMFPGFSFEGSRGGQELVNMAFCALVVIYPLTQMRASKFPWYWVGLSGTGILLLIAEAAVSLLGRFEDYRTIVK